MSSSAVENVADVSRTSSEIPWASTNQAPSLAFGPGDQPFFVANQENGARSRQRLVISLGIQLLITPDRHKM